MTLNELITWCNEHGVSGDLELAVHVFGGIGGAGQSIAKASLGFDWDKGKLMLHPKFPLTLLPPVKKAVPSPQSARLLKSRIAWLMGKLWMGSQTKMAAALGVSQSTIANILAGRRKPGRILLSALAAYPSVNENWLRHGVGAPIMSVEIEAQPRRPLSLSPRPMLLPKMETKETGTTRRKKKS